MSKKVALMCGHGRSRDGSWDSGCAYGSYTEAGLMLPITKAAVKYLRKYGVTVYSDADTDNNKNMLVDVAWANAKDCDIYVSVHCDYKKAPSGVMPLYVSAKGKKLATALNNAIKSGVGMKSRGVVRRRDLYELNATEMPAVVLETGGIASDLKILKSKPDTYGKAIAKGICDYLGVSINKTVKAEKETANSKSNSKTKASTTKTKASTTKKTDKKPTVPSLKVVKTTAQVIEDTIKWAKHIAADNDFHYGRGNGAHHNGCCFCDTNDSKKGHGIKEWEHTYCCNPFVHAAWSHGGMVPSMLDMCRKGRSYGFAKGEGYDASSLFEYVGLLKNVTVKKLKAGDVICTPSHAILYIGGGKICHAGYEDDNVPGSKAWIKSICVQDLKDSWHYKNQYSAMRVYRFTGKVNAWIPIRFGECSERVKQLQECLGITADGFYGDKTLKAVKKFKKAHGLNDTGVVSTKTVAALKKAVN